MVNIGVHNMKQNGLDCNVSDKNIKLSFLMYTSYFVLFGHFFYEKYIASPSTSKKSLVRSTIRTNVTISLSFQSFGVQNSHHNALCD